MLSISRARPITATTATSAQRLRAPRPVSHMIRCQGTTDARDQTPQKVRLEILPLLPLLQHAESAAPHFLPPDGLSIYHSYHALPLTSLPPTAYRLPHLQDTPIRARIAGGLLAATLLVASVLPPAHAANGNPAALLVEIQETELPGLQSDVGKIRDPTVGAKVERRLNELEAEVATIAEKYEQGKIIPAGLAIQTSHVLNELNSLKGEMRAHE